MNAHASLQALGRALPIMCIIGIVAAAVSYDIARRLPPSYEVHFSYMVALQQQAIPTGFQYDGYYALSGTELFSSTLASLITSPENIVRAYATAHIPLASQDPVGLVQHVQAEKVASQLVQVTVRDASQTQAEALASAVQTVSKQIVQQYDDTNKNSTQFSITPTMPWTGMVRVTPTPIATIAGVFAVIISAMIVLFRESLRRDSQ